MTMDVGKRDKAKKREKNVDKQATQQRSSIERGFGQIVPRLVGYCILLI